MLTPSMIAQELEVIAGLLEAAIPQVEAIVKEPTVMKAMQDALNDLEVAIQAFIVADMETMPTVLLRIENDVNAVLGAMATLPLPPTIATSMRVVQVLLPTVIAIAGMLWL